MSLLVAALLVAPGCVLWDDAPFRANVARLTDADADGVSVGGGDCNDADPDVYPGAIDACDGLDNDCDGETDEVLPTTVWCQDVDGDGFGDIAHQTRTCYPEAGWVLDCTDCDDADRAVSPDGTEGCNGVDDDCDGVIDPPDAEGAVDWWVDDDGDGYGASGKPERSCDPPSGAVQNDADCNDAAPDTYPGAPEICGDGRLNDCDGDGKECGWSGQSDLSTGDAAFIRGPEVSREYFGLFTGFVDVNADGVDDLLVSSAGEMYGGESRGALHVWYGAPTGERSVDEAAAHVVGVPGAYLGWALRGANGVRVEDAVSGGTHLLTPACGPSSEFGDNGVVLVFDDGLYGERTAGSANIFARGRVPFEYFGAAIFPTDGLVQGEDGLVIGAPYNEEAHPNGGAAYIVAVSAPDADSALATIRGDEGFLFGDNAVVGQDFDGDGADDIVMGSTDYEAPSLYLYTGPLQGDYLVLDADGVVLDRSWAIQTVIAVGDVDSDGLPDLAVQERQEVQLVQGDLSLAEEERPVVLGALEIADPRSNGTDYGMTLADFGQDGVMDFAIGVPDWDSAAKFGGVTDGGAVAVVPLDRSYLGGVDLWSAASAVFYGPDPDAALGLPLASGDVNADGYPDLLASAAHWEGNGYSRAGGVWFLLGGGI